uniref:Uncharacterized protein n=1 Tax=Candidatus Kentrum sp. FW TaxID=2126338 RepID=A0A450SJH5_9GAMM|nr:MAG: hypothetical protein BECKFW1821B_GA0114236_101534 [Candidatus Kentron sp. FW]
MKKHLFHLSLGALCVFVAHTGSALAVEVAPRISDREIIERLTGLEEGQKRIEQRMEAVQASFEQRMDTADAHSENRMDAMETSFGQRMDAMEASFGQRMDAMKASFGQRMDAMEASFGQRMDAMEASFGQRMDAMEASFGQRMDAMEASFGQRIDAMEAHFEKRMDAQWNLTLVMIAGIFGLIGFVVWDRKTALKPLERRFARIAHELERDLDVDSPEGSRLTRLIAAVREFAPDDPRLAEDIMAALKRHSLLVQPPKEA